MTRSKIETQQIQTHEQLTSSWAEFLREEIYDDLAETETDLVVTTTDTSTNTLKVDVLKNPIKTLEYHMKDPTESLPAWVTLGTIKNTSGTITHIAFVDASWNVLPGTTALEVEKLYDAINKWWNPVTKDIILQGQLYRCAYTVTEDNTWQKQLDVEIDLITAQDILANALNKLPKELTGCPVIPNAPWFESARPNTQQWKLDKRDDRVYPRCLYQRIIDKKQVGKPAKLNRIDMIWLWVTVAELASGQPQEKTATTTLPDTWEIIKYKAVYTVVGDAIEVTITQETNDVLPDEFEFTHVSQIDNGIDANKLSATLDQQTQQLYIDHTDSGTQKITGIDLSAYPWRNTFWTTTTIQGESLPTIPMPDGRILRLGITIERKADGKCIIWTKEISVAHETIQFANADGTLMDWPPMGKRLRRLRQDSGGTARHIIDESRYGTTKAKVPITQEDFDHTPGHQRPFWNEPLFIDGKAYHSKIGVDAGGTHLLQLQEIQWARWFISWLDTEPLRGGTLRGWDKSQPGKRQITSMNALPISSTMPEDNRNALDAFFMKENRSITLNHTSPDGKTMTNVTLNYVFEDIFNNKGIIGKNTVVRHKKMIIGGKEMDLQFRLEIKNGRLQMRVDNVTERPEIKIPEIVEEPKDHYKNFVREDLVYNDVRIKWYFEQLDTLAEVKNNPSKAQKFKQLYPGQRQIAGIPLKNSKITIFRTDEFKPLTIENPLESGVDQGLFSIDLAQIPAEKWASMKPIINADGSRKAGKSYTFNPKVTDNGTAWLRPAQYNNETRPTKVTLEPIRWPQQVVIDDKGDYDPDNDTQIIKRPILWYATRIKVDIPATSEYRSADREIDREKIQQQAKEAWKTVLEFLEGVLLATWAFLWPIWKKIREKIQELIERIPGKDDAEKAKDFVDVKELLAVGMARPLPGNIQYEPLPWVKHENIPDFMDVRDFWWRRINKPTYRDRIDFHPAIDIWCPEWTAVTSVLAWKVIAKSENSVTIRHDNKVKIWGKNSQLETTYYHVKGVLIQEWDTVSKGQQIAQVDNERHLHFSVGLIDPLSKEPRMFTYPDPKEVPSAYVNKSIDTQKTNNKINPEWFFDTSHGVTHTFRGKLPEWFTLDGLAPTEAAETILENADRFVDDMEKRTKAQWWTHLEAYKILQSMHFNSETLAITGIESTYWTDLINRTSRARWPYQVLAWSDGNGYYADYSKSDSPFPKSLLQGYFKEENFTENNLKTTEDPIYINLNSGTMIGMSMVYAKIFYQLKNKTTKLWRFEFQSVRGRLPTFEEDVKKLIASRVGEWKFNKEIFDDVCKSIRSKDDVFQRWTIRCKYTTQETQDQYKTPYRATHALATMYLAQYQLSWLNNNDDDSGGGGNNTNVPIEPQPAPPWPEVTEDQVKPFTVEEYNKVLEGDFHKNIQWIVNLQTPISIGTTNNTSKVDSFMYQAEWTDLISPFFIAMKDSHFHIVNQDSPYVTKLVYKKFKSKDASSWSYEDTIRFWITNYTIDYSIVEYNDKKILSIKLNKTSW